MGGIEAVKPYARKVMVNTATSWWRRKWRGERPTAAMPERSHADGAEQWLETAAREAGLVGRRRVLDSTPLYDSVSTMDTITLIRSAIRGLLNVADPGLAEQLRAVLTSGDKYVTAGKPVVD